MEREKTQQMSSLSNIAWKRFRKDALGIGGLLVILLTIFVSIFAYVLATDGSPYANQMHL